MTARGVGPILVLLVLCMRADFACADRCPTEAAFLRWQVLTSENAWANEELPHDMKHYPISNLFDGSLRTAWVFEGLKLGPGDTLWGYPASPDLYFRGGEGHWIEVRALSETAPLIDAVGIVNGYAKSPAIYERNNRVTRVHIETGPEWVPRLLKTVDLEPVMWMQIIAVPETAARPIRVRVEKVEQGSDNDLCISELQLYHRGLAVIPRPPPYLIYSPGDECGCGYSVYLVDLQGTRPSTDGRIADRDWHSYSFSHNGRLVALSAYGGGFAVVDTTTGRPLYQSGELDDVVKLEWVTSTKLRITTWADDQTARWQLDLMKPQAGLSSVSE